MGISPILRGHPRRMGMAVLTWVATPCILMAAAFSAGAAPAPGEKTVNPESVKTYNDGLALYNQGKFAQSVDQFRKAEEIDPLNTAAIYARGLALGRLNRHREAAQAYSAVLGKDPAHRKSLIMLPSALAQAGDAQGALAAYDKAITALPAETSLYIGKARLLILQKKYDDALAVLEKARSLAPKDPRIRETTAYVLAESGKLKEASVIATEILASNPSNARAHLILADSFRLAKKFPEALDHYRAASKNLETKAYAEHFIDVIKRQMEEDEIEREYEARQKQKK